MANYSNQNFSSSSNYYQATKEVAARSNIQASAYTVDAVDMALKGFHYSTCGERGGGFEVSTSPPPSPRTTPANRASSSPQRPGLKARSRSGGAAYTITEECERLFCETLDTVFLGEGNTVAQDSLVMGMRYNNKTANDKSAPLPSPSPSTDSAIDMAVLSNAVREWVEIWEYSAGLQFRGFVTDKNGQSTLFVFFDKSVIGPDLKNGLMCLLELAGSEDFGCSNLVVCLDRSADQEDLKDLTRDLGWVGFELTTLDRWSKGVACTSDKWIFLDMEV
ncbi:hypothetical protein QM012_005866 [Aureobasidium pullulans]|uniref:Ornithine decarboxylase antizyme n=1 Tax=Aureobasidium pullulans TaxID=5580 RepID=A0ABR0TQX4_AURPU